MLGPHVQDMVRRTLLVLAPSPVLRVPFSPSLSPLESKTTKRLMVELPLHGALPTSQMHAIISQLEQ